MAGNSAGHIAVPLVWMSSFFDEFVVMNGFDVERLGIRSAIRSSLNPNICSYSSEILMMLCSFRFSLTCGRYFSEGNLIFISGQDFAYQEYGEGKEKSVSLFQPIICIKNVLVLNPSGFIFL